MRGPDTLDATEGERLAVLFADAGCPALVLQGFPASCRHLVRALPRVARVGVSMLWHGHFLQVRHRFEWDTMVHAASMLTTI